MTANGGYARGFKEFRNMMREKGPDVINGVIYGQEIVDAALAQLDKRRTEPTYLFFGTIDTHGPWIARKPWIDIYSPRPYNGPFQDYGTATRARVPARPDGLQHHPAGRGHRAPARDLRLGDQLPGPAARAG